jgi:hypothetical protein
MQHQCEQHQDVATSLITLVDDVARQIDEPTLDLIRDFLAKGEHGTALEWLLDLPNVLFTEAQIAEIQRIAGLSEIKLGVGSSTHLHETEPAEIASKQDRRCSCC